MAWSYRQDCLDEIYSTPGASFVSGDTLPSTPTDSEHAKEMLEPETPPQMSSNLTVAGAGSVGCNGNYTCQDANTWRKPSSAFMVVRSMDYPEPGVPWWNMSKDANVFYKAPDCPFPWDAVWELGLGAAPLPTVTETTGRSGPA